MLDWKYNIIIVEVQKNLLPLLANLSSSTHSTEWFPQRNF